MKFGAIDRILQLGITPALTAYLKDEYPDVSSSLWQRQAKKEHRRILSGMPEPVAGQVLSRQCHAAVSLCCLLVGFHVAVPDGADMPREAFDALVQKALCSPVVPIAFGSVDYRSHEVARAVEAALSEGAGSANPKRFSGSLAAVRSSDGQPVYACTVERCGLMRMLVEEKRFFLLGSLCKVEEAQVAMCGGTLLRTGCIASGDQCCRMTFEPAKG